MTLTIRPARPDDLAAITRIYAHAVRHGTASFELDPPDEAEMARRMTAILDGGFPYLAADVEGRPAGYAYASSFRTRPAYRFTLEDSIYVAPDRQGRGVGRALLDRLIAESAARGFRQMIAVIGDSTRQHASIRLHAAAGFALIGAFPNVGYKFGVWLDSVYMQRALGGEPTAPPTR
ncbi:MAG: GNAT family N-acetyltransferase [Candidatus Accumulibacter sp.]|jgi:phosphinothricin acetyltransferase|nr:GNAT family N-acetyltransferase [Accumulibacter sp.]